MIFYGSVGQPFSCLYECNWKVGDCFAVSAWLTTEQLILNHLGYTNDTLRALKAAKRTAPSFAEVSNDSEQNRIIRTWQARVFTQHVPAGQEELYRLPIALKDFALPTPGPFSGILYPSIAMYALMDNVALLIPEVDTKLKLFEVIFLTVESSFETPTEDGGKKTGGQFKVLGLR